MRKFILVLFVFAAIATKPAFAAKANNESNTSTENVASLVRAYTGAAQQSDAQLAAEVTPSKWRFGIRGGYNSYKLKTEQPNDRSYRMANNVGIYALYNINKWFVVDMGLAYNSKGYADEKLSLHYIELPVRVGVNAVTFNVSKNFTPVIRPFAEPYIAYGFGGVYQVELDQYDVEFGSGIDEYKAFDFGVKLGLDIVMGSFTVGAAYDLGLQDISNDPDNAKHNRGYVFQLGFSF